MVGGLHGARAAGRALGRRAGRSPQRCRRGRYRKRCRSRRLASWARVSCRRPSPGASPAPGPQPDAPPSLVIGRDAATDLRLRRRCGTSSSCRRPDPHKGSVDLIAADRAAGDEMVVGFRKSSVAADGRVACQVHPLRQDPGLPAGWSPRIRRSGSHAVYADAEAVNLVEHYPGVQEVADPTPPLPCVFYLRIVQD